jgi:hypothetical protein
MSELQSKKQMRKQKDSRRRKSTIRELGLKLFKNWRWKRPLRRGKTLIN